MPKIYRLGGKTFADLHFNNPLSDSLDVTSIRDVKNILREIGAIGTDESWNQTGLTIEGIVSSNTGASVSLSSDGRTLAIGSPEIPSSNGYSSVYRLFDTTWVQLGTDIVGENVGDESGFYVSLSSDGTRVAVGAPINSSSTGHVRVHEWNGVSWVQLGSDINGEATSDRFGYNLALSKDGTTVVTGAYLNDNSGTNSGSANVHRWDGSIWQPLGGALRGEADGDWFGRSVSISADGNKIIVGASLGGRSSESTAPGYTKIYEWNGVSWNLQQKLTGIDIKDWFGFSVSMSNDGNTVAIGAPLYDTNTGYTTVYRWNDSSWVQLGDKIDGAVTGELSAYSLSISADGNIVAIGTNSVNGYVRVYEWNGTQWIQIGTGINSTSGRLSEVSISDDGTFLVVGNSLSSQVKTYNLL